MDTLPLQSAPPELLSVAAFATVIAISTVAGISIARRLPWRPDASAAGMPVAIGILLGPFLFAFVAVTLFALAPGLPLWSYPSISGGVLLATRFAATMLSRAPTACGRATASRRATGMERFWLGCLLVWIAAAVTSAIVHPLLQNDALEYMMVASELARVRDLSIYPLVNADASISGFFAPWTHPPLFVSTLAAVMGLESTLGSMGSARLVSVWFLSAAVAGTVGLGRTRSQLDGTLGGVVLVSTPLLFLGADSSLVDPLPVAGSVLVLSFVTCLAPSRRAYPFVVGAAVGLALWTHSGAILFMPLAAALLAWRGGLSAWRRTAFNVSAMLVLAAIVGGWTYIRNLTQFGGLISDSPVVFDLPALDWASYFQYARGINHATAAIQYGLFKGWTCLEAYGPTYWLAAAGGLLVWRRHCSRLHHPRTDSQSADLSDEVTTACILWIAVYMGGMGVSVLLGIDVMVRNERYFLVTAPAAGVLAGMALARLLTTTPKPLPTAIIAPSARLLSLALRIGLFVMTLAQFLFIGVYVRGRHLPASTFSQADTSQIDGNEAGSEIYLRRYPDADVARAIGESPRPVGRVLALRPSTMAYAPAKMLSYLDPRMLPLYDADSAESAARVLQELGVTHVQVTDYSIPPFYNSALMPLLSDPRFTTIEYSNGMSQLYALSDSGLRPGPTQSLMPDQWNWSRIARLRFLGRKGGRSLGLRFEPWDGARSTSTLSSFHRHYSTSLETGGGSREDGDSALISRGMIPAAGGVEYVLDFNMRGEGFVQLWICELDASGTPIRRDSVDSSSHVRLGELPLDGGSGATRFLRRFRTMEATRFLTLSIEHLGRSWLELTGLDLVQLIPCENFGNEDPPR